MNLYTIVESSLRKTPEKTAVICGDTSCTYAELEQHSNDYARALTNLGLGRGDRLGLFMYNRLEIVYCYFACFRLGVIAVPSSIFSKRPELLYEAGRCGTKMYLVDGRLFSLVEGLDKELPELDCVLSLDADDQLSQEQLFSTFLNAENSIVSPVDVPPDHPAAIFYTSGSTGRPKGVTHTHGSFYANAEFRCKTLHQNSGHSFLTTSFLCHAAAPSVVLFPTLYSGGTAMFLPNEEVDLIFPLLLKHPVTHMAGTPVLWQEVFESPLGRKDLFTDIEYATCGGSSVPAALLDGMQDRYDLTLTVGLGMTECGGYMITPPDLVYKKGSVGKPLQGVDVRLVNDQFMDVADGDTGQILVRGKNVFSGYWLDPDSTDAAFHDGWFLTGDLGRRDKDGYYYFSGRCKNTLIIDSGNITPEEVELVLNSHPQIAESFVVGVPDPLFGQSVFAFIQPLNLETPPLTEDLKLYMHERLAERKLPRYYYVENLQGEGIMGKINRKKMTQRAVQLVEDGLAQSAG